MDKSDRSTAKAPRSRRKDARPAELIEAGLAEFAARGFAGTRLDDVAMRAGVVKGTIYRYFADKEALFLAAVQSRATPVVGGLESAVAGFQGPTRELLQLLLKTVYARLVDSDLRVLMRVIIAEGVNFPGLTALYHREMISKGKRVLEMVIQRGIARGEVRNNAAADLPMIIMAPAIMAAVWKMTFDPLDPVSSERFLTAHLALLDEGLLRSSGETTTLEAPAAPR